MTTVVRDGKQSPAVDGMEVSYEKQQTAIRLAEDAKKVHEEKYYEVLKKRQQELKSAEEKLEKARNAQKEVALKENSKDDEMVRIAEAFKKAKENRDKVQGFCDAANRPLETGCHDPCEKRLWIILLPCSSQILRLIFCCWSR